MATETQPPDLVKATADEVEPSAKETGAQAPANAIAKKVRAPRGSKKTLGSDVATADAAQQAAKKPGRKKQTSPKVGETEPNPDNAPTEAAPKKARVPRGSKKVSATDMATVDAAEPAAKKPGEKKQTSPKVGETEPNPDNALAEAVPKKARAPRGSKKVSATDVATVEAVEPATKKPRASKNALAKAIAKKVRAPRGSKKTSATDVATADAAPPPKEPPKAATESAPMAVDRQETASTIATPMRKRRKNSAEASVETQGNDVTELAIPKSQMAKGAKKQMPNETVQTTLAEEGSGKTFVDVKIPETKQANTNAIASSYRSASRKVEIDAATLNKASDLSMEKELMNLASRPEIQGKGFSAAALLAALEKTSRSKGRQSQEPKRETSTTVQSKEAHVPDLVKATVDSAEPVAKIPRATKQAPAKTNVEAEHGTDTGIAKTIAKKVRAPRGSKKALAGDVATADAAEQSAEKPRPPKNALAKAIAKKVRAPRGSKKALAGDVVTDDAAEQSAEKPPATTNALAEAIAKKVRAPRGSKRALSSDVATDDTAEPAAKKTRAAKSSPPTNVGETELASDTALSEAPAKKARAPRGSKNKLATEGADTGADDSATKVCPSSESSKSPVGDSDETASSIATPKSKQRKMSAEKESTEVQGKDTMEPATKKTQTAKGAKKQMPKETVQPAPAASANDDGPANTSVDVATPETKKGKTTKTNPSPPEKVSKKVQASKAGTLESKKVEASTAGTIEIDAATLSRAKDLSMQSGLMNLAGRPEICSKGLSAASLLAALEKTNGLVNPAKHLLLGS